MEIKSLSKVEQEKLKSIMNDPVLWAKTHIITYDNALKKICNHGLQDGIKQKCLEILAEKKV